MALPVAATLAIVPSTFPAHQGFIVPLKLRWPNAIDATALCIGAAAPDFAYPLGLWLNRQSHTALGLLVWAIPFTLVAAAITRWRAAAGIFAVLPDLGPLRLRSYGVLTARRPKLIITLASAVIGSGSHVLVDGFTHSGRWGATWLGLDRVVATVPLRGEFELARVFQYLGHLGGSVVFIVTLVVVASSGRLENWYGTEAVERARSVSIAGTSRLLFWAITMGPPALAVAFALLTNNSPIFLPLTVLAISTLVAGTVASLSEGVLAVGRGS